MKLNSGNVNTFNNLKEDKPVVVAYLMKGCHWCDQMKPEWNNMKQNISGDGILAEVTVVNGDKSVIDRMVKPGNCVFEGFEPWEDETVILTFRLLDYDDIKPINN